MKQDPGKDSRFAWIEIDLSSLAFIVGAVGVGVGFGLQNLVNNFVSGLILLFERPVQTGDTVEVGTLLGSVRRIGIRSSVVRTRSYSRRRPVASSSPRMNSKRR